MGRIIDRYKECSKCEENKPYTEEYYRLKYDSQCRKCARQKEIEYRQRKKEGEDRAVTERRIAKGIDACRTCKKELPVTDEFWYRRQGILKRQCKGCDIKEGPIRSRSLKEELVELKGGKCNICEYDKCIQALEFHHIDPSEKDFSIAEAKRKQYGKSKIIEEISKCLMVCANCHREIHMGLVDILDLKFEEKV